MEQQPTTAKLAQALRETGASNVMIARAEAGYYDDFKSPLATPIMQLVADARAEGFENIAIRAMNGEWDAQQWEAKAWAQSPDGQAVMKQIMKGGH